MSFSFDELDLSENEVDSGVQRLRAGRYECKITDASLQDNRNGGKALRVDLADVVSGATISDFINVHLPKAKPEAQKIGRDRLKTLLTHAGHPSPENPKDVKTMIGLTVGVNVEADKYTDSNGEEREGSSVASWHPYFDATDASGLGPIEGTPASVKPNGSADAGKPAFDDDIPF